VSEKHEMTVRLRPSAHIRLAQYKLAGVAQLVERLVANEKVAGSNPVSRSYYHRDTSDVSATFDVAGSSNGRTTAFEAVYLGSNPSPAANKI
jgi:hypothetical protein